MRVKISVAFEKLLRINSLSLNIIVTRTGLSHTQSREHCEPIKQLEKFPNQLIQTALIQATLTVKISVESGIN